MNNKIFLNFKENVNKLVKIEIACNVNEHFLNVILYLSMFTLDKNLVID